MSRNSHDEQLLEAFNTQNFKRFKKALKKGANPNIKDAGMPLLLWA